MYMYMFLNEKERSKQGQTNKQGKATQHTKAVTFPRKNELPQVGLEPTTLYTCIHVHVYNYEPIHSCVGSATTL